MARIEGIDLPRNKRVEIGLTYLYGVGLTRSQEILAATKVNPDTRIKDLTEAEVAALRDYIGKHLTVEGDLRREEQLNIKRLIEIGCYRGMRHRRNLPVHGQRTRTNSRTRKGPKKTVAGRGRRRGEETQDAHHEHQDRDDQFEEGEAARAPRHAASMAHPGTRAGTRKPPAVTGYCNDKRPGLRAVAAKPRPPLLPALLGRVAQ